VEGHGRPLYGLHICYAAYDAALEDFEAEGLRIIYGKRVNL
jgi:hypothetical protein